MKVTDARTPFVYRHCHNQSLMFTEIVPNEANITGLFGICLLNIPPVASVTIMSLLERDHNINTSAKV